MHGATAAHRDQHATGTVAGVRCRKNRELDAAHFGSTTGDSRAVAALGGRRPRPDTSASWSRPGCSRSTPRSTTGAACKPLAPRRRASADASFELRCALRRSSGCTSRCGCATSASSGPARARRRGEDSAAHLAARRQRAAPLHAAGLPRHPRLPAEAGRTGGRVRGRGLAPRGRLGARGQRPAAAGSPAGGRRRRSSSARSATATSTGRAPAARHGCAFAARCTSPATCRRCAASSSAAKLAVSDLRLDILAEVDGSPGTERVVAGGRFLGVLSDAFALHRAAGRVGGRTSCAVEAGRLRRRRPALDPRPLPPARRRRQPRGGDRLEPRRRRPAADDARLRGRRSSWAGGGWSTAGRWCRPASGVPNRPAKGRAAASGESRAGAQARHRWSRSRRRTTAAGTQAASPRSCRRPTCGRSSRRGSAKRAGCVYYFDGELGARGPARCRRRSTRLSLPRRWRRAARKSFALRPHDAEVVAGRGAHDPPGVLLVLAHRAQLLEPLHLRLDVVGLDVEVDGALAPSRSA